MVCYAPWFAEDYNCSLRVSVGVGGGAVPLLLPRGAVGLAPVTPPPAGTALGGGGPVGLLCCLGSMRPSPTSVVHVSCSSITC
jgi:hypothetical protein